MTKIMSHSISQEAYIIWLWLLVHMYELMTSSDACLKSIKMLKEGYEYKREICQEIGAYKRISQKCNICSLLYNNKLVQ